MSEKTVVVNKGISIGFFGILTIVLIVLKLTNVIAISWWWIVATFFAPIIFIVVLLLFAFVVLVIAELLKIKR